MQAAASCGRRPTRFPRRRPRSTPPSGVAIDPSGAIYVSAAYNNRVFKLSPTRTILAQYGYGSGGSADGTAEALCTNTTGIALVEAYDIEPLSVETARAVNVSTRGVVGADQARMIAGFVIDGSSAKRVLIRAVGPALAGFGVSGTVAEPQLELYTGRGLLQASAGARGLQANADEIRGAAQSVSAFAFAEGSEDSAMVVTLLPGAWTVQVGRRQRHQRSRAGRSLRAAVRIAR